MKAEGKCSNLLFGSLRLSYWLIDCPFRYAEFAGSGGHDRNWTEENRITQGREQQPGNIFILALLVKPCSQRRQEREKTWRVGEEKGKSDREEGPGGHRGINQWIHIQSVHGRTGRAYQGMTEGQLDLPSSWLCPQSDISGHPLPFP